MRCTLMHGRHETAELEMDERNGAIRRILSVLGPERLPVGVPFRKGAADRAALNLWWRDRAIPATRSGLGPALSALGLPDEQVLPMLARGASLTDRYWLRAEGDANDAPDFFNLPFSGDVGDALLTGVCNSPPDFRSPDCTTDGNLVKRWEIAEDGTRVLLKGGSSPYRQQPFNEVIAARVAERLGIPCVPYEVTFREGAPYSLCPDLVTEGTELVPAWRIWLTKKKPNDASAYGHFVNCAETLGIPGVIPFLDRMIVLDWLIADEDRHLNNFAALRDPETLEWIGMAPVFDSGTSLGWDRPAAAIRSGHGFVCKPFRSRHEDQLRLVRSFDWLDLNALSGIREEIVDVLTAPGTERWFEAGRAEAVTDLVENRIEWLGRMVPDLAREAVCPSDKELQSEAATYGYE